LKKVNALELPVPLLTGFGIHDFESRNAATEFTSGAVVGTAFIRELAAHPPAEAVARLMNRLKKSSHDYSAA
jgi:tryptophan synthase alpha subunit